MVEAEFGLAHLTGSRDGPPVKVGVAVTDLTTGLYAVQSILAALWARSQSVEPGDGTGGKGEGQHLDVCLSDCQVATLANMGESVLVSGQKDTGRWGTAHRMFFFPAFLLSLSDFSLECFRREEERCDLLIWLFQHPSSPTNPSPRKTATSSSAAQTTASSTFYVHDSRNQNGPATRASSQTQTE